MPPFPGAEKGKCVNHESWFHHAPTFSPPLKTFEGPINHFSHSTMRYAFFDPDFSRIEFEFKSCALSRARMRIFIPDLLLNYEWKARKNKIGAKKKIDQKKKNRKINMDYFHPIMRFYRILYFVCVTISQTVIKITRNNLRERERESYVDFEFKFYVQFRFFFRRFLSFFFFLNKVINPACTKGIKFMYFWM